MTSTKDLELQNSNTADGVEASEQTTQPSIDTAPRIEIESMPGLFNLPGYIPDSAPVDQLNDFMNGKVNDFPETRRPFGNSVNMAMNAIEFDDELLDYFFQLKKPSDAVRNGAQDVLVYMLSELHAKDVTICGLIGGCVARFMQKIPELANMVDTREMDSQATLDPTEPDRPL